jgi:hypothetical protein
MKAIYVPPEKTPVSATDVVRAYREVCRRLWSTDKPETVAALVAQSALETARWASMWNFGVGNVKASPTYEGLYTAIFLNEVEQRNGKTVVVWYDPVKGELVSKNGPPRYPDKPHACPPAHPQCRMRAFKTLADGVADKIAFLNWDRYKSAKAAALTGDPSLYVRACKAAGYFTAALEPYERAVVSLFKTYLPIAQKDDPPAPLPPPEEAQVCKDMVECMRVEIPEWLRNRVETQVAVGMSLSDDYWRKLR